MNIIEKQLFDQPNPFQKEDSPISSMIVQEGCCFKKCCKKYKKKHKKMCKSCPKR